MYDKTGHFALSTQSGFSFVNHSVAFVELAPSEYAPIKDILLKYRDIKLKDQGHYGNTGWLALPELKQATGKSLPELSRELQRMSLGLFAAHPLLYGASVARSWVDFWTVPLIWQPERL